MGGSHLSEMGGHTSQLLKEFAKGQFYLFFVRAHSGEEKEGKTPF